LATTDRYPQAGRRVAVTTDGLGNIYLTGSTRGRLAGDNSDYSDVWVTKYARDGEQLWIRQFGAVKTQQSDQPPLDRPFGIAVDAVGNVFIAGITTGLIEPAHFGDRDLFLVKLDTDGNQVWARQLGDRVNRALAFGVAVNAAGDIFVGKFARPKDYQTSGIGFGGLVAKFDQAGGLVWDLFLGKQFTRVDEVVAEDGGAVVVAGYTESFAGIKNAAFVARYDAAGTLLAARPIGPTGVVNALARDPRGNLFAAGRFDNKGWIAELDASLRPVWTKTISVPDPDHRGYSVAATAIAADGNGKVFAAGAVFGPLYGASRGEPDAWLAAWRTSQE
jgi:outer membrane protein assembly factor BamB